MDVFGLCDICRRSGKMFTCMLCGKRVCINCFALGKGVCRNCLGGMQEKPKTLR